MANNNKHVYRADVAKRGDIMFYHYHQIHVSEGWNARENFTGIEELAEDIAVNGMIQSLQVVRDEAGRIAIIDGERRYRAVGYGISKGMIPTDFPIPTVSRNKATPVDRLIMQYAANTGVQFTILEKANIFSRLHDAGLSMEEIGRRCQGVTKQTVSNILNIPRFGHPDLIELIRSEAISGTLAIQIIKAHSSDPEAQLATAKAALDTAAASGKSHATAKNIAKPQQEPSSQSGQPSPQEEPEESQEPEGEQDDEPPTTVIDDTPRKDKVNPPPNPDAYKSIVDAPTTNRDGSSTSSGPTEFTKPDKQLERLDALMEKLEFTGPPHLLDTHNQRFQTAEVVIEYLKGTTTADVLKKWILCSEKK
jgi:ParB-like chromosome segregation protein Spo0J